LRPGRVCELRRQYSYRPRPMERSLPVPGESDGLHEKAGMGGQGPPRVRVARHRVGLSPFLAWSRPTRCRSPAATCEPRWARYLPHRSAASSMWSSNAWSPIGCGASTSVWMPNSPCQIVADLQHARRTLRFGGASGAPPPHVPGPLASLKKFVARLCPSDIMPAVWAGVRDIRPAFVTAQVDTIRQAGEASAARATWENSALIYRRLGHP
jgi:hypothetical protein